MKKEDIERMERGYARFGAPAFLTGKQKEMYWKGWHYEQKSQVEDLYPYPDLNTIFEEEKMIELLKWYTYLRSTEMFQKLFEYVQGEPELEAEIEYLKDQTKENQRFFMNGLADHLIIQAINMELNDMKLYQDNPGVYGHKNERPEVKEIQESMKQML